MFATQPNSTCLDTYKPMALNGCRPLPFTKQFYNWVKYFYLTVLSCVSIVDHNRRLTV